MRLVYTSRFVKTTKKLPQKVQSALAQSLELLSQEPHNPRLHTKALKPPLADMFSFRIGREYRALFTFDTPHTIILFDVAHRKDIYR